MSQPLALGSAKMKLYYIELTYDKCVVNVGEERFLSTAKRLLARLNRDTGYMGMLKAVIKDERVSLKNWIRGN